MMNTYPSQWEHLHSVWKQERIPHALMFVGAFDSTLMDFVTQYVQLVFCKQHTPCQACLDCQLKLEHPDLQWIKPDKKGGPIKIDQIRELQTYSYLTPQRSSHRLIIIESADRMNNAAANALLKILEEPAPHTLFVLLAQQLSTVLPTVLSRCQLMRFSSAIDLSNLFALGEHYAPDSDQALIIQQAETILDGLISVVMKQAHPCSLVAQWSQYELQTLLWFLYLVYAQIQFIQVNRVAVGGIAAKQINQLASSLDSLKIFSQVDKINAIQRKLSNNMNINHNLAMEDLLFDL